MLPALPPTRLAGLGPGGQVLHVLAGLGPGWQVLHVLAGRGPMYPDRVCHVHEEHHDLVVLLVECLPDHRRALHRVRGGHAGKKRSDLDSI